MGPEMIVPNLEVMQIQNIIFARLILGPLRDHIEGEMDSCIDLNRE